MLRMERFYIVQWCDMSNVHANSKFKKISIKSSIQIIFNLQPCFSYAKIFKTRPHMPMFAWYFKKIFLNTKYLILTTGNKYFNNTQKIILYEQNVKHDVQIIMFYEQNIKYHEHLII